jgi:non-homologous end joining protein Ku
MPPTVRLRRAAKLDALAKKARRAVAPDHKGRGYELAKGQYLIVDDAELEAIEIESTHTIEIDSFVPSSSTVISSLRLIKPAFGDRIVVVRVLQTLWM